VTDVINLNGVEYIKKEEYDKIKGNRFWIPDPCNCMAIVKVSIESESYDTSSFKPFPKENECDLIMNLKEPDVIDLYIKGQKMSRISTEFYNMANKTFKAFGCSGKLKVYAYEKDAPCLLCDGEGLGFIIAPRIEQD
jgi:hypothetical protein